MDFHCCSERWTCPSRPCFPLLNLQHIAHLGCFRSLWPKWNYLLLKLKHSKEATKWTSIFALPCRAFLCGLGGQKRKKLNSACWFALRSAVLIVLIHKTFLKGSTAPCEAVANTFAGHSHSMHQDLDDKLPNKSHGKWGKKNTPGWMVCCKYKHLVFHRADTKAVPFMITQQSTILSSVWQQLMQMCAVQ